MWVAEVLVVEQVTATERGLEVAKACQVKTEVELWKSLEDAEVALQRSQETLELERNALESERKARSKADQEVLALHDQVMGTEEASAQLHEQVARQADEFSTLENFHVSTYLFYFSSCCFLPSACF